MPNGGIHNCAMCKHLGKNHCNLRQVSIPIPHWTTCRSWNTNKGKFNGPLIAIIGQVRDGAVSYGTIPYFNGQRPETIQRKGGDTTVHLINTDAQVHEFDSVDDYMAFYEKNKKE